MPGGMEEWGEAKGEGGGTEEKEKTEPRVSLAVGTPPCEYGNVCVRTV